MQALFFKTIPTPTPRIPPPKRADSNKSPVIGFVPDTTKISAEIANVANVNDTYKAKREYGTHPVDEWYDNYIKDLKAAGIETIRDELQAQYDAWKASK